MIETQKDIKLSFKKDHYIELWKVFVLTFITLGFYQFYWSYYTWKFIKEETNSNISPFWRTIPQVLPIIPIGLLFYETLLIVTKLNRRLLFFIAIILSIMVIPFLDEQIRQLGSFNLKLIILALEMTITPIAFILVQNKINKYILNKNTCAINESDKRQNNKYVFLIGMIGYLLIGSFLMCFTNINDGFLVFITITLSILLSFITIELYEKKRKEII